MVRRPSSAGQPHLHRDERSGFRVVGILGGEIRRFHRAQRGVTSLLFLLLGFVFYAVAALVFNTGVATQARIQAQTAADTAAYSSAVWQARCVNTITGTNMLILRNGTAHMAASGVLTASTMPWYYWYKWAKEKAEITAAAIATVAAAGCLVAYPICWAAEYEAAYNPALAAWWAFLFATEIGPHYLPFVAAALPTATAKVATLAFLRRISTLYEHQEAWLVATPKAIEEQRKRIAEYYKCDIHLSQSVPHDLRNTAPWDKKKPTEILPPLKPASTVYGRGTTIALLTGRFWVPPYHDSGWYHHKHIKKIKHGKGRRCFAVGALAGQATVVGIYGAKHHTLTTSGLLEGSPSSLEDWKAFSVVAAARLNRSSRGRLMAPGIFSDPIAPGDVVIAYAQAETYNGIDGRGQTIPVVGQILKAVPFRVWTSFGWQWQARLTWGDQLANALRDDPELRKWFKKIDVDAGTTQNWSTIDDLALH